ncbi:host cell factor 1b isoform X2 [Channa argus]|uniref:host cell factor 1b isoform X2 n=1 Tax=Channa argus TaxID=215402 RepID=UPI003522A2B8
MASPTSEEPGSCTSTTIITAEGNTGHTAADTGIPCSNPTCETHETGTTNTTTTAGAGGVRQCVQIHHVRPTRPEPPTLPLQLSRVEMVSREILQTLPSLGLVQGRVF